MKTTSSLKASLTCEKQFFSKKKNEPTKCHVSGCRREAGDVCCLRCLLLRLDWTGFFFTSRDRKFKEDYIAVVDAAARREWDIWLDLSVRATYVRQY